MDDVRREVCVVEAREWHGLWFRSKPSSLCWGITSMTRPSCLAWVQIAMLKRINHPNIIRLVEVLDDPKKDQLFMGMRVAVP